MCFQIVFPGQENFLSGSTSLKRTAPSSRTKFDEWTTSRLPLAILAVGGALLLWTGLGIRSLWGPEGRWAVIVQEMVRSGHYLLPTMNGSVYFDKPLLTYWAMLPFVWVGGVNEAMLRLPGTIAGVGSVLILFLIGRRLFDARAGFFSAAFLLTAPMFLFWSRTASAEAINTFTILLMFWAFLKARLDKRPGFLLLFYAVGAAGCFVKGPVAPAVCLFAVLFFSAIESGLRIEKGRMVGAALWKTVGEEFSWLLSGAAVKGILCGLLLFAVLLLLPVVSSGSWFPARLMWRENVIRFLAPFDHRDPPSVYLVSILQFSAPWTFLMLFGLVRARYWKPGVSRRWTLACASGVLLFFLVSGSRRSYYILPFLPFLALIAGKSATDWIEETHSKDGLMRLAAAATAGLFICGAAALCYVYLSMPAYRHGSEVVVVLLAIPGSAAALLLLARKKRTEAISMLLLVFFMIDMWGFTAGMRIAEGKRTLRAFAGQARATIEKMGAENVALFDQVTSESLFYLNCKSPLTEVKDMEQIEKFARTHPAPLLLIDLNDMPRPVQERISRMTPLVVQQAEAGEERLALVRLDRP